MAFADANREAFDKLASEYDVKPWQQKMTSQLNAELDRLHRWMGVEWIDHKSSPSKEVRLLDYACGTGMISRALGPHVTQTAGIDISPNMVRLFNEQANASGLPQSQCHAVVGDLLAETPSIEFSGPEYHNFDVVAVGLGFHHFENHAQALARLTERLKPGGVLLILDLLGDEFLAQDTPEHMRKTMHVTGFSEERMKELFEAAELKKFALEIFPEKVRIEFHNHVSDRAVFLAKGTRA